MRKNLKTGGEMCVKNQLKNELVFYQHNHVELL